MENTAKIIYLDEYRKSRERKALDLLAILDRNLAAHGISYEDHHHLWKALGKGLNRDHAGADPPDDDNDTPQRA